jgi:hypothetical protein
VTERNEDEDEVPEVRVRDMRLDGDCPAAVRDTAHVFDLAIDFSHSPQEITAALTALFQEAIDSHRWARRQGTAGRPSAT